MGRRRLFVPIRLRWMLQDSLFVEFSGKFVDRSSWCHPSIILVAPRLQIFLIIHSVRECRNTQLAAGFRPSGIK